MKKIFTLIAVAAMAFAAQAAEWTAADGTATDQFAPVYGYYFDEENQHNQMQYPVTELTGLTAGTEITGMKFYTSTPDLVNALNGTVKVSLANMDDVTPWTLDGYGYVSGNLLNVEVTTVAATVAVNADADGAWIITFDAPFIYTGNALLVDVETVQHGTYKETKFYGKEMDSYLVMSTYGNAGTKKGQKLLPKVTFTYEGGGEEPGITTLSQANALEDNAEFTFEGDAVVTACLNGNNNIVYLFLRDESGYGMIADIEGTFENGQVLSQGWSATKTNVNNGWVRYIDAAGLSASGETNAELAAPQVLQTKPTDDSMLNAYVVIENTTISSGGGGGLPGLPGHAVQYTLPDNTKIGETQELWSFDGEAGDDLYNVYGIICKVSNAYKIQPIRFEKVVAPPAFVRGDVNGDTLVGMDDLALLISYLLDPTVTINQPGAASCNDAEDTQDVNMDDLAALITYLLANSWD